MTEHRGTKRLRTSISLPGGLGATFPRVEGGELCPTVFFDADQAYDISYHDKPTRFAIGDAIALASSRGRHDIVEHIKGPALEYTESVQARVLSARNAESQTNAPPSPHLIQYYHTILALCIGKSLFEVDPEGRVVMTGELKNVYAGNTTIMLLYTADIDHAEKSIALMEFGSLRSRSGNTMLFGQRFIPMMPLQWVWDWRKVKYNT